MTAPPPSPRAVDTLRELHGLAVEAGYTDPLWGALVIAAMALASLEERVAVDLRKVIGPARDREGRGLAGKY